jgi:hypothetical protein
LEEWSISDKGKFCSSSEEGFDYSRDCLTDIVLELEQRQQRHQEVWRTA